MLCLDRHAVNRRAQVGHYIPGTRIPVVDEAALFAAKPMVPRVLLFSWHLADHIVGEVIRVPFLDKKTRPARPLQRHENLTMCTSAWSPKRLPEMLINYLRGRGQDKVMLASDHPDA